MLRVTVKKPLETSRICILLVVGTHLSHCKQKKYSYISNLRVFVGYKEDAYIFLGCVKPLKIKDLSD